MKTKENDYNRTQQYIRENYQWVNVNFNKRLKEDMEILEWLNGVGESKAQYIKRLIRKDMEQYR